MTQERHDEIVAKAIGLDVAKTTEARSTEITNAAAEGIKNSSLPQEYKDKILDTMAKSVIKVPEETTVNPGDIEQTADDANEAANALEEATSQVKDEQREYIESLRHDVEAAKLYSEDAANILGAIPLIVSALEKIVSSLDKNV